MGPHLGEGLFKHVLNRAVYQDHTTNYVVPLTDNGTMVRLLDRSESGRKPPREVKRKNETLTSTAICDTGSIWFGK